ncbi:MAG: hypothetical protein WD648_09170 [Planctomycetaceae bacterium]
MATRTKSAPRRTKRSAEKNSRKAGNFLTRLFFQPKLLFGLAVLVSIFVFFPQIRSALPDLGSREEFQLRIADISITPAPRWVAEDLVAQVVARAGRTEPMSRLDKTLVEDLAAEFKRHPWVANVSRVRLASTGIEVDLSYRQPVGMVQLKQGIYPVDANGTLLPPEDFSADDIKHFPLIRNVKSTPQGPAGTNWGDEGVLGAAQLAEVVGPHWNQFNLVAIHVPDRTSASATLDDMIFELSTAGGSRIVWGRAPESKHPGELTPEQKIGRLEEYQSKYGVLDKSHGPYRIEIYHWKDILRRPLSAQAETPPVR